MALPPTRTTTDGLSRRRDGADHFLLAPGEPELCPISEFALFDAGHHDR